MSEESIKTTNLGERYVCEVCASQFLITQQGNLPNCCDKQITPI